MNRLSVWDLPQILYNIRLLDTDGSMSTQIPMPFFSFFFISPSLDLFIQTLGLASPPTSNFGTYLCFLKKLNLTLELISLLLHLFILL